MGKTYEALLSELSPERRERVQARAEELIAEVKSLRDLRQTRRMTQARMAAKLGVKQHSVSRLEQRTDMLLSTLRDYIREMGGELVLIARFPERDVRIDWLAATQAQGSRRGSSRVLPGSGVSRPRKSKTRSGRKPHARPG